MCLDEFGQAIIVCLVKCLQYSQYKDGHKMHYASGQTMLFSSSNRRTTDGSSCGCITHLVLSLYMTT